MQDYIRIVMPLINEVSGYEYKGKTPSGRCLLESRNGVGKIIIWAQDLKHEAIYRVNLIFEDTKNNYVGIPLCALTVHANGKGELKHSFNATDIEGFNIGIESCVAVAIIVAGASDTSAPLCGYKQGEVPWRRGFKKLTASTRDVLEEILDKPSTQEPPEADIVESRAETEMDVEVEVEVEVEETDVEVDVDAEVEAEDDEYIPVKPDPQTLLSDTFKAEVNEALKSHTHMQPFKKPIKNVQWVRISLEEDFSLPDYICDLLSDPFVEKSYSSYNHLILGKSKGKNAKRYYIGVPSLYDPKDKLVGFRQFKCSEDKKPKEGDYGYWLVFMA